MRITKAREQFLHQCWSLYRHIQIPRKPKRDCWLWDGPVNGGPGNYGYIYHDRKKQLAHRFSWSVHNQRDIPADHVIAHTCDNPQCVSPYHLQLATQRENVKDMIRKNRQGFIRKLTARDCAHIRRSQQSGSALARKFGVSDSTITRIRKHKYK